MESSIINLRFRSTPFTEPACRGDTEIGKTSSPPKSHEPNDESSTHSEIPARFRNFDRRESIRYRLRDERVDEEEAEAEEAGGGEEQGEGWWWKGEIGCGGEIV